MLFWKLWESLTIPTKIILSIYSHLSYLPVGKKSTSPPNSFTRCCKRNRKTCYFGKFKHAWPHTPKMIIAIWRNLWHLSVRKRSTSSFMLSLRYYKDIVNLLFWVLWACLAMQTQCDTITFRKLSFLLGGKKSTSPTPMLFCRYCKDMQTTHFEYFQHAWLHKPKMIVPTWRRFGCLSTCQKYTSSFTSFLRYYILKNPATWSADSILVHNLRPRIFPDMGLVVKYQQQY